MQLIVAGYSRGKLKLRNGEVYTIDWPEESQRGAIKQLYEADTQYGAYFSGRSAPIHRFIYGFDRTTAKLLGARWDLIYRAVQRRIGEQVQQRLEELKEDGTSLDEIVRDKLIASAIEEDDLPDYETINPFSMISRYSFREVGEPGRAATEEPWEAPSSPQQDQFHPAEIELLTGVMEGAELQYLPLYYQFSIHTAVDFVWHMLVAA